MPCRILIVEDDRDIRASIKVALEIEGCDVVGVGNGREALEILNRSTPRPDVIVLDLMMPVMSGHEFLELKSQREDLKAIPVVVISAMRKPELSIQNYRVKGLIRKPFSIGELVTLVKECRNGDDEHRETYCG